MTDIITVNFHGADIIGFKSGLIFVFAVKPIAVAMGLDWPSQFKRIQQDPVLSEGIVMMTIPLGPGGPQDTICLDSERLHGWLFKIETRRIKNPAIRDRILVYQRECCRVLERHFSGNQRRAVKDAMTALNLNLQTIRATRAVFGLRAAQEQWRSLDMPWVPEMEAVLDQGDLFSPRQSIEWKRAA
jgi:hypothetical protein